MNKTKKIIATIFSIPVLLIGGVSLIAVILALISAVTHGFSDSIEAYIITFFKEINILTGVFILGIICLITSPFIIFALSRMYKKPGTIYGKHKCELCGYTRPIYINDLKKIEISMPKHMMIYTDKDAISATAEDNEGSTTKIIPHKTIEKGFVCPICSELYLLYFHNKHPKFAHFMPHESVTEIKFSDINKPEKNN